MARLPNDAASAATRFIKSPNCWQKRPIRSGPGSEARPGNARIKLSGGRLEAPNTKLTGPVKWSCFNFCVILDIGRRRFVRWGVVGWRIKHAESATLLEARFCNAMARHAVPPDQLTLHAATIRRLARTH